MPYKVIQTIENSKAVLTAVPEQWEKVGILTYPKKKYEKYRRNEESVPNEKWISINCILKRSNLTFQEAEEEIERMCKNSDTETDREDILSKKRRRQNNDCSKTREITKKTCNFNQLAEDCNNTLDPVNVNEFIIMSQENDFFVTDSASEILLNTTHPEKIPETQLNSLKTMHSKLDNLAQNVKMLTESVIIVQKNQQELYDIQQQVLLSLANFSTQFDEIIKKTAPSQPEINQQKNIGFKPISDIESFDAFEKMLLNSDYAKELLETMSIICGTGRGKGINNAYALVDVMFTRDFLQECSWTGGSRAETSKICFKSRNNTIEFFFKVINRADNRFTLLDTHQFFKVILRNSKQRSKSQQQRTSVTKTRVQRPKTINLAEGCVIIAEQSLQAVAASSKQLQAMPQSTDAEQSPQAVPTSSVQVLALPHAIFTEQSAQAVPTPSLQVQALRHAIVAEQPAQAVLTQANTIPYYTPDV